MVTVMVVVAAVVVVVLLVAVVVEPVLEWILLLPPTFQNTGSADIGLIRVRSFT